MRISRTEDRWKICYSYPSKCEFIFERTLSALFIHLSPHDRNYLKNEQCHPRRDKNHSGLQSAQELARKGATVIIACRTISKGEKAIEEIKKEVGESAKLEVLPLDLTDYDSIRKFVSSFKQKYDQLDILMNNLFYIEE